MTTRDDIRKELNDLYNHGVEILLHEVTSKRPELKKKSKKTSTKEAKPKETINMHMDYQKWYSRCLPVVRQLLPDRYSEFCEQYKQDKRKEITYNTYTIADYMIGLQITRLGEPVFDTLSAFSSKFQLQLTILHSALTRLDSVLNDIAGVLQAQIFDSEIEAAEELLRKKHLRAAGALGGVTIEAHLGRVAANHQLTVTKKDPSIGDLNELLKAKDVIDIPAWRHIQRLADIRNICVHAKGREPAADEVQDLLSGVRKIITSVF
jgi:hypothetical protein